MNCYPIFIYLVFIILYIVLFIFLFQPKLENIIYIFLFILTVISGFNTLLDIRKKDMVMNFKPIEELFDSGNGLDLIKAIFFSPFTTIVIFIFFIFYLITYLSGKTKVNQSFIFIMALLLFVINMVQMGISIGKVNIIYIFMIPIIIIILSLLFITISIYKLNNNSTGNTDILPFSQTDPKNSDVYRLSLIIDVCLIICFMIYFVLFYSDENDKKLQYQLYTVIPLIYGISAYNIYISSNILNKKYLGK